MSIFSDFLPELGRTLGVTLPPPVTSAGAPDDGLQSPGWTDSPAWAARDGALRSPATVLAEQKIKLTPRDPLPFRTDRVESLQQPGADQSLRRKGVPTQERKGRVKGSRKISQRAIRRAAYERQREVGTRPLFKINMECGNWAMNCSSLLDARRLLAPNAVAPNKAPAMPSQNAIAIGSAAFLEGYRDAMR
jgi:hypothetical protein